MDRTTANRLLSKILAYVACGKPQAAKPYAEQLIAWLQTVGEN